MTVRSCEQGTVRDDPPAVDDFGLVVRMIGGVVVVGPISVTQDPASNPWIVAGTVTANQGTNPWIVSGAVTVSGAVDQGVPNIDANSWPVHQVGALPAGGNVIGQVGIDPAANDVDVVTLPPVTQGTSPWVIGDGGGSITVDTSQLPAALVGGRLTVNVGAWLASTAPTVGQKTMASSIPVTIASDQSTLVADATITDTIDALNDAVTLNVSGRQTIRFTLNNTAGAFTGTLVVRCESTSASDGASGYFATRVGAGGLDGTKATSIALAAGGNITRGSLLVPAGTTSVSIVCSAFTGGSLSVTITAGFVVGDEDLTSALIGVTLPPYAQAIGGESSTGQIRVPRMFDLDTGAGTQFILGVNLRGSAGGGSQEMLGQKTMANSIPIAIASDQSTVPVGLSTWIGGSAAPTVGQKTMASSIPIVISSDQSTVNTNIATWIGSAAPTVGQKVSAASIPVVLPSDQTVSISGTVNQGTPAIDANSWPVHQVGALPAGGNIIGVVGINGAANDVDAVITSPLTGGRVDTNIGAWFGALTPTVGQKTMANSIPVVIPSDQSTIPINLATWIGSAAPTVGQKVSASSIPVVLASDQSAISVSDKTAGTLAAGAQTAVAAAAVAIAAANANRRSLIIQNVGAGNVRVGIGGVTNTTGFQLLANGGSITFTEPWVPTNQIFAIREGATSSTVLTQEVT